MSTAVESEQSSLLANQQNGDENYDTNYASAPSADAGAINDADDAPAAVVSGSEDPAPADHGSPTSCSSPIVDTTTDMKVLYQMFAQLGEDEVTACGEKVMAFVTCDTCQGKDGKTIEQLVDIGVEAARDQQPLAVPTAEFEGSDFVRLPVAYFGFYGWAFICACLVSFLCSVFGVALMKIQDVVAGCVFAFAIGPALGLLVLFLFGQRRIIFLDKSNKTLSIEHKRFFCTTKCVNEDRVIPMDRLRLKIRRIPRRIYCSPHPKMTNPLATLTLSDVVTGETLTLLQSLKARDRPWWACLAPCWAPPCEHWQSSLAYYYVQHVFLFQAISGEKFTHLGVAGVSHG